MIVTGAIIYYLFSNSDKSKMAKYKGFEEDRRSLSSDWENVYQDYNNSYSKIANV